MILKPQANVFMNVYTFSIHIRRNENNFHHFIAIILIHSIRIVLPLRLKHTRTHILELEERISTMTNDCAIVFMFVRLRCEIQLETGSPQNGIVKDDYVSVDDLIAFSLKYRQMRL